MIWPYRFTVSECFIKSHNFWKLFDEVQGTLVRAAQLTLCVSRPILASVSKICLCTAPYDIRSLIVNLINQCTCHPVSLTHPSSLRPRRNLPIPSISTLISSPWFKTTFGSLIAPIPGGVPVIISDPRSNVVPCDKNAIVSATPKIISFVFESWTTVPLWMALMSRLCGSMCSCATRTGPMGAAESKPECC